MPLDPPAPSPIADPSSTRRSHAWPPAWTWGSIAIAVFHLAYETPFGWWIALFPFAVLPLTTLKSPRRAFYAGLVLGLALYGPQLAFFWTIFGPASVALWLVLAFWMGLFLVLARQIRRTFDRRWCLVLIPLVWTGLEYFRGELYYLRFTWLSPGFALAGSTPMGLVPRVGVYGLGTLLFLAASIFWFAPGRFRWLGPALAASIVVLNQRAPAPTDPPNSTLVRVAGAQIEALADHQVPAILDQIRSDHPDVDLIVLPEYALDQEPSAELLEWCRRHRRHLIVGGKETVSPGRFRNTAWVIDTDGVIVFRQAKSVPIQFFDDGLPADRQSVWTSPWGRIGLAICYDLSYRRVMDELVRQGAQALVIPTMDLWSWGERQHRLHGRVAPLRAAEYRIPLVRCASSGASQIVDPSGQITAGAPIDDQVRLFAGTIAIAAPGSIPVDRWLAPGSTVLTAALAVVLAWRSRRNPSTLSPAE